tara:strand:- start:599 stop:880 length:282 start_codon:yes stop_codon:yes gene_type:complete
MSGRFGADLKTEPGLFEQVILFDPWRDDFHVDGGPDRATLFLPDESQEVVKRRELQTGESRMESFAGVEFTDLVQGMSETLSLSLVVLSTVGS